MTDSEKVRRDFLIAFHSNFVTVWFRDNEVLLPTGNGHSDLSARGRFTQLLLMESARAIQVSWFIDICRVSLTVSELFDILFWLVIAHSAPFYTPKFHSYTFIIPKRVFLTPERVF